MPQLQATQPLLNPAASSWSPTAVSASLQHNSRFLHNAMSGAQPHAPHRTERLPRAAPVAAPRRPAAPPPAARKELEAQRTRGDARR